MLPAEQRLVRLDLARRERHDRLVVEPQLVALDGVGELPDAAEANDRRLVELRVVEREAEAGLRLRAVHRRVRLLQQLGRVVADGDADRRLDRQPAPFDLDRLGERLVDPLRDDRDVARVDDALDDHRELVAAEARRSVGRANHLLQPVGERTQHRVADVMPEAVVHALEAVDVREQDRRLLARLANGRDRAPETVVEVRAVREPRQRVVQRLPAKRFLRLALGRDVEQVALQIHRRAVLVGDDDAGVADPHVVAVARLQAVLGVERLVRRVRVLVRLEHTRLVLRMQKLHEQVAVVAPVLDGVAEQPFDLAAREDVRARRIERVDVDDERQLLDERAVATVELAALAGCGLALEDDARDARGHLHHFELALGRPARNAVVQREGSRDLAVRVEDRRRPARAQPVRRRELDVVDPERVACDVLDDDRLLRRGRRAARAGGDRDRHAVDRGVVGVGQPRRDVRAAASASRGRRAAPRRSLPGACDSIRSISSSSTERASAPAATSVSSTRCICSSVRT